LFTSCPAASNTNFILAFWQLTVKPKGRSFIQNFFLLVSDFSGWSLAQEEWEPSEW
jgi:hypothetical protein